MIPEVTTSERPLKRILAGTDGSERAQEAVRQAARLASSLRAELIVAFVIDAGRPHEDDVERIAEGALAAASDLARSVEVEPDVRILTGDPGKALIDLAQLDEVDLVCVGPDAGLFGGVIRVGRTAAHVLRQSRCSVLVARRAGTDFPQRISCAVDGSETSVGTALMAAAVAAATGGELRLIHVIPVFRGHNAEWTLSSEEESPPELNPSVLAASSLGVTPVREMAMGRPERALVAAAERDEVDLMVVGHRGVSGVGRALLGSVSERVAHRAQCSVLVARLAGARR